ncbi:MAG: hypothetical protein AB9856_12645 [Cellulosilyticaceae bacterium]
MNTYSYSYGYTKRRRRFNFKLIFALVALIGGVATAGLAIKVNLADKKIEKYTTSISDLQKQTQKLEESVPGLSETLGKLEKQAGDLKDVMSQMKPIVVPDSMK